MATYCRSAQEIEDDSVVECHTKARQALREMCNGRLLYPYPARKSLEAFEALCERVILGELAYRQAFPCGVHAAHYAALPKF